MTRELTGELPGELTGGCACGAIRYKCSEKPIVELICHCRDCQRASGGAISAVMLVASDRLTHEGAEIRRQGVPPRSRWQAKCRA